ncbi:hypothetical protein C0992_006541 [Termitomyces sp. T32_za158]|nr:hypothetical protein C0992_006541 [Termitomyces sp. T32_za158]
MSASLTRLFLKKWVKGELLGKGSYARVYYGLNATTGDIMAVKQVELPRTPSDMLSSRNRDIADALKFERKTLARLDHPNIVRYLGYEESTTYLSIFLEYVPGGTISSCLRIYGVFSEEVTKSFTRQILEGLGYLHGMGIIHRDLKSDNILVEPTGICKISDFGISKQVENIAQAKAYTGMRGTIFWMAPEILDNDKQGYDLKVDIWSTGCVVLEMWTGERPWFGEELYPVMIKLSLERLAPPIPAHLVLDDAAHDFHRQCFQRNPQDRPYATELRDHHYLVLPPSWKFESFELSPFKRLLSQATRGSCKTVQPPSTASDVKSQPPVVSMTVENSTNRAVVHTATQPQQPIDSRQKIGNGPRVVIITPPGSPRSQISQLPNNSRSSLEMAGPVSTPIKGYRLVNPDDPDSQTHRKPFVYNPPPLPSVNGNLPFSSRLQPISNYGIPEAYPVSLPSKPPSTLSVASSRQAVISHSSDRPRTQASHSSSEYRESDSEVYGDIWAKPPSDLSHKGETTRPVSHFGGDGAREDWPRPVPAAVYENLQDFFPEYDLEKPVVPIISSSREHGRDRKKSIRVVAKDRAQSGPQRGTKLWDNKVEELHM